jgi:large subunit ribosomal protein L32e
VSDVSEKTNENTEFQRLLKVRKDKKMRKPKFRRHDWHKKKRLSEVWRRPRGIHNKMRRHIKGKGALVKVGYRVPSIVRNLHPSGKREILVHNPAELEDISGDVVIRIGRTVGMRKRISIQKKAEEMGLIVVNKKEMGGEES